MRSARLFLLFAALLAAGCGDDTPTQPSGQGGSPLQELYSETLAPGGATFYAFQSAYAGAARVTLINVTTASGAVLTTPLKLVFGVPQGTGCGPTTSVVTASGFVSHATSAIAASTYCVSVADPGTLTDPVTFLVRIAYPVASIPRGTPGTETWTSTLTPMGTATRTIVATSPGVLSVQLDSLGGASGPVDFAFGIPGTDGRGCYLTRSVRTSPGSSSALSLQADPGLYCVRLADTGQLTSNATFSVSITHP
jgi:hypothetical protein